MVQCRWMYEKVISRPVHRMLSFIRLSNICLHIAPTQRISNNIQQTIPIKYNYSRIIWVNEFSTLCSHFPHLWQSVASTHYTTLSRQQQDPTPITVYAIVGEPLDEHFLLNYTMRIFLVHHATFDRTVSLVW